MSDKSTEKSLRISKEAKEFDSKIKVKVETKFLKTMKTRHNNICLIFLFRTSRRLPMQIWKASFRVRSTTFSTWCTRTRMPAIDSPRRTWRFTTNR